MTKGAVGLEMITAHELIPFLTRDNICASLPSGFILVDLHLLAETAKG